MPLSGLVAAPHAGSPCRDPHGYSPGVKAVNGHLAAPASTKEMLSDTRVPQLLYGRAPMSSHKDRIYLWLHRRHSEDSPVGRGAGRCRSPEQCLQEELLAAVGWFGSLLTHGLGIACKNSPLLPVF